MTSSTGRYGSKSQTESWVCVPSLTIPEQAQGTSAVTASSPQGTARGGVTSTLQSLPVLCHAAAAAQLPPLLSDRGAVGFGLEILLLDDLKAETCAPVPAPSEGELYTHRCTELLAAAEAEVQAGCIYLLGKAIEQQHL